MPKVPGPARLAFQQTMADLERKVRALETQQQSVITDPTKATGDPSRGYATVLLGSLKQVGISAYGVAVYFEGAWHQITGSGGGGGGERGERGERGEVGPAGKEGPRGATGETGSRGPTGETGATGKEGPEGAAEGGWETGDWKWSGRATCGAAWIGPCEGQAVSRSGATLKLFEIYGVKYGAGNGSTTFNLPDQRNATVVGASSGRPLGNKGGEENVTLSTGQMPKHNHVVSDPGHNHTPSDGEFVVEGVSSPIRVGTGGGSNWKFVSRTSTSATGISLGEAGGGGSHTNMPPYVTANLFVRL